jgi:5-methylcytosine-specific restriction enzyme A
MPLGAYQECRYPRCPAYATRGGYCVEHQSQASQRPGSDSNLTAGNKRFRVRRLHYLRRHPMCAACKRAPATILDHRIPHRGMPLLFWSEANWQGLCVHCHGVKTARENLGGVRV